MPNRFTDALHQLQVVDLNESTERFSWIDLRNISRDIWNYTFDFDEYSEALGTDFIERLSERWILLGFIAAMSDEDIDELIINWKE